MKNLYIHIGMPKTGSSAIQAFFACNNELLQEVDYCYPWHPGFGQAFQTSAGNATNLHHWIIDEKFEELERAINNIDQKNIILSSEVLFHTARLHPKSFAKALKKFNIKLICYIRKIDDLMDSCVNQLVKNHGMTDYSDLKTIINDHDYSTTLINLSNYIDKKKINIRIYDRSTFTDGDIYQDILEAIEINKNLTISNFKAPEKTINPSLVPEAFELRRHLNSISFNTSNDQIKYDFNGILASYSVEKNKEKFSILTKEERKKTFDLFKEREMNLNKHFFGSENRIFSHITNIEKPKISLDKIGDVLFFIYKKDPRLLFSIIKKTSTSEQSRILLKIFNLYLFEKIDNNDKANIAPLIKPPVLSVLPYNFNSLTYGLSNDTLIENIKYATRIESTGRDPYYSLRTIKLESSTIIIIITMNSNVSGKAQLHYQTNKKPFYGENKFQLKKVSKGYNELKFIIKEDNLNGKFRFDPIMSEGIVDIYNTSIYS
ncbi:hypothetical protein [Leucothrix arctica]|uniref:Sulfotransferase domain-containing protein n=1 Tax=Leucothrix arctica TaxID=1481894 RepID=A0A317CMK6_9GAMM|nr:hypothetical protein [Leucothrix arctica]PWQ98683.1 hypothetical protein DKT75_02410 [Leucothrix arctica]